MDVIIEQLYVRKKRPIDYLMQAGLFLLSMMVSVALFLILAYLEVPFGSIIVVAGIFGIVYLCYKVSIRLNKEFEYIVVNGEIDVDQIINRMERKRLLTIHSRMFDKFEKLDDPNILSSIQCDKKFDLRSYTDAQVYYAIFNHKEYKKTLLIFEPEERIVAEFKKYATKRDAFSNLKRD